MGEAYRGLFLHLAQKCHHPAFSVVWKGKLVLLFFTYTCSQACLFFCFFFSRRISSLPMGYTVFESPQGFYIASRVIVTLMEKEYCLRIGFRPRRGQAFFVSHSFCIF